MMAKHLGYLLAVTFSVSLLWWLPSSAQATASLGISPASGTMTVNETKTVAVAITTGGQAINSVQATITFPTDKLEVTSISKGSILTLWTAEPSYSNSAGAVSFSGGVPSPGYEGHGTIISITFKAKVSGSASISIVGGTILANDGRGTNVYGGAAGATYNISAQSTQTNTNSNPIKTTPAEPDKPTETKLEPPAAPVIISATHPNSTNWYSDNNPKFSWASTSEATQYSWILDHQTDTVPDDTVEGLSASADFTNVTDGVWYLHVKAGNAAGWGGTGHYQLRIDATAPDALLINLPSDYLTKDRQPTLNFYTQDKLSGIAYYAVLVDGQTSIARITPDELGPFALNPLSVGKHILTVQALDQAGNRTETISTLTIFEEWPIAGFMVGSVFIAYTWVVLGLSILAVLLAIWLGIFFMIHKKRDVCIGDCHIKSCPHFNPSEDHCEVNGRLRHHKKLKKLK